MKIWFILETTCKTESTLVDSGATENFIDLRTVAWLHLPMIRLPKPWAIRNIDGTANMAGQITQKCELSIYIAHEWKTMAFFITNLGINQIVLGYPFLWQFNPTINWQKGKIIGAYQIMAKPTQIWEHCWKLWRYGTPLWKVTFAQQWAAKAQEKLIKLMAKDVPLTYQKYQQVFMEEEAKWLPPRWVENMTIPLKKEAPPQMDCKTYLLSTKETKVLW